MAHLLLSRALVCEVVHTVPVCLTAGPMGKGTVCNGLVSPSLGLWGCFWWGEGLQRGQLELWNPGRILINSNSF